MSVSERLYIALRYTFALGKGHLSAFLSLLSMLGLVLAIGLLIVVLSVMNGFDKEMRERILGLVPHISVYANVPSEHWQQQAQTLAEHAEVVEVIPFTGFDALVMSGQQIETVRGTGLQFAAHGTHSALFRHIPERQASEFLANSAGLILGADVARRLAVQPGDKVTVIVPGEGQLGIGGPTRNRTLVLTGLLASGTELDQGMALVHLALAADLAGLSGRASGFQVRTNDLFAVQDTTRDLLRQMPPGYYGTHWMMTHGNLYAAIQLSRRLVAILLFSIITVAAFNVVSSLVLVVLDKQGNIAILRTLGASRRDIAWIFVLQGGLIGLVGVVLGSIVGALGSIAVPTAVAQLENWLQLRFLNTDVYPVAFLPSDLLWRDVVLVAAVALLMCLIAAIYPARRAAALAPAAVLNQER